MESTKKFHQSVKPCENWGKPHKCYSCACAFHSIANETNKMGLFLEENGIECVIEQTGGFVMVGYIFSKDRSSWISFTNEGMGWCKGNWEELDIQDYVNFPADFLDYEKPQKGLTKKHLVKFLNIIRKNLHLIGR